VCVCVYECVCVWVPAALGFVGDIGDVSHISEASPIFVMATHNATHMLSGLLGVEFVCVCGYVSLCLTPSLCIVFEYVLD